MPEEGGLNISFKDSTIYRYRYIFLKKELLKTTYFSLFDRITEYS